MAQYIAKATKRSEPKETPGEKRTTKKKEKYIDKESANLIKDQITEWKLEHSQKKLDKSLDKQGYKPTLETRSKTKVGAFDKSGRLRSGLNKGGRAGKQFGGRTNLLEELGRVEGEPSNRNRRAEISRVHGELNRGYKSGGAVLKGKKVGIQIK